MKTKSKITERKVESEKYIRLGGVRMQQIDILEGQSILRSHLKDANNIPEDLVHFCKTFFPKADWTDWYFKKGVMDPVGFNRSLKPSSAKLFLMGMCDKKQKFIVMDPIFCSCADVFRVSILLHEMTHAVTTETHTKRFFGRLKKCEDRARKLGGPLAKEINKDIKEMKKAWLFPDGTMRKDPQGFKFQDEE